MHPSPSLRFPVGVQQKCLRENCNKKKHFLKKVWPVSASSHTTIGSWCWFEDDANCFRGWVPRLGCSLPLGRAEEFCQYWLQPVYPGLGRDDLTNFKNIGDFLCNVLSLSLSLSQHRCVACDGMEVCASLTRAEPPGTDGSHRANWRERLSAQVSGASFQVHHHQIFARQVYRVSCMFDLCWILDAVSTVEWHSAWRYVSWDVMMLLQSETFFLIMSSSELWEVTRGEAPADPALTRPCSQQPQMGHWRHRHRCTGRRHHLALCHLGHRYISVIKTDIKVAQWS